MADATPTRKPICRPPCGGDLGAPATLCYSPGVTVHDAQEALTAADALVQGGRILEAIDHLSAANRRANTPAIEERLVALRHLAWQTVAGAQPVGVWPRPVPDLFPHAGNPPECAASELTAERLASAIQHHGSLLVRGLFSAPWCAVLREDIDRGMEAAKAWVAAPPEARRPSEWFAPFAPAEATFGAGDRAMLSTFATAYTAESPRTLFHFLEALGAAGVDRLLGEYFGERPAFSLIKSAFRRTAPGAPGGWHQDGYVAGAATRTVNIWAVVSRCGATAPGLDLLPRRMHDMLPTRKDLPFDFVIDPATVEELARETPVVRPEFAPGDALFFDQFLVHQTGWNGDFTETRYGFESWFFAPSTFPVKWFPFVW